MSGGVHHNNRLLASFWGVGWLSDSIDSPAPRPPPDLYERIPGPYDGRAFRFARVSAAVAHGGLD